MENIIIVMVLLMKGNGKKINNMEKVKNCGQMEQSMRVNTLMEKNMDKESSFGLMEVPMMESFNRMKFMVMVYISGNFTMF